MINVACLQPKINKTDQQCYDEVEGLLSTLLNTSTRCDITCLPEKWIPLKKNTNDNLEEERGSTYNFIKHLAKDYGVGIISGAIWEKRAEGMLPRITSYYFDDKGDEIGRQDKIHLYS